MEIPEYTFYPAQGLSDYIMESTVQGTNTQALFIAPEVFEELALKAFASLSFTFTRSHLKKLIHAALDKNNSGNDRFVASFLLKNAAEAAKGELPLCQDTGIACVFGWKGSRVIAGQEDRFLSEGIRRAYKERSLRFSTVKARSFFEEYDPSNNLPAQIALFADSGSAFIPYKTIGEAAHQRLPGGADTDDLCYRFLFCAKGGGSSNKTALIQGTKALLNPASFDTFLQEQVTALGTAACPPYSIVVIAGGLSPEQNLFIQKLAAAGLYDGISPEELSVFSPNIFRDIYWEKRVMEIAAGTGLGAQFGGRALAVNATVLRLPRHSASCPVSIGVSCSAHRNLRAFIDRRGFFIEKTAERPEETEGFAEAIALNNAALQKEAPAAGGTAGGSTIRINFDEGITAARSALTALKPGQRVLLSGKILVARDAAHARWQTLIDEGKDLPSYTRMYPICYAGPAETPAGKIIGSFGPTTAGRMDSYAEMLMQRGAALITLAKGNRSEYWKDCCKNRGGFYLGTIGGAAALISGKCIESAEVLDYPELGMEAVRLIGIKDLPAFIIIDDKGNDFYASVSQE